jgi:hypothetical protein
VPVGAITTTIGGQRTVLGAPTPRQLVRNTAGSTEPPRPSARAQLPISRCARPHLDRLTRLYSPVGARDSSLSVAAVTGPAPRRRTAVAAPNGATGRQRIVTGDAFAEAAPTGIDVSDSPCVRASEALGEGSVVQPHPWLWVVVRGCRASDWAPVPGWSEVLGLWDAAFAGGWKESPVFVFASKIGGVGLFAGTVVAGGRGRWRLVRGRRLRRRGRLAGASWRLGRRGGWGVGARFARVGR